MTLLKRLFGFNKEKANSHTETIPINGTIDLTKVYPRIKAVFSDQFPDPIRHQDDSGITLSHDNSPVFKPLADGIAIFYAIDTGNSYELIQNRHLSDTITLEKLHDAALTNMSHAVSDKTEVNGDPNNIMMVTNGGNFEATMMLADSLWEQLEPYFNDKICIAIPARDLLFISAKNNPAGRESLRKAIRFYFGENSTEGLIVRHIYERTNTGWSLIETA